MALPSRSSSSWPRRRSRQSATAVTPVVAKTTRPAMRTKSLRRRVTIEARERSTRMPPRCSGGTFFTCSWSWGASSSWPRSAGRLAPQALRRQRSPPLRAVPPGQPGVLALGRGHPQERGLPALPPLLPGAGARHAARLRGRPLAGGHEDPRAGGDRLLRLLPPLARRKLAPGRQFPRPPDPLRGEEDRLRRLPRRGDARLPPAHRRAAGSATASTPSGRRAWRSSTASSATTSSPRTRASCPPGATACAATAAEGVHPARFSDTAPMQFDCGTCHKPHAATPERGRRRAAPAATWWRRPPDSTPATSGRRCTTCHAPHLWTAGRAECVRCHAAADRHADGKGCTTCHLFRSVPARK